ncbi:hypothetical protein Tco_0240657 [Tanacetum coccineum]
MLIGYEKVDANGGLVSELDIILKLLMDCPEYSYGRSPQPVLTCCFCLPGRKEKLRTRCSSQAPDIYFGAENARVSSVTPEGGADMTLKRQNKKRRVYMGIWSCFPKETTKTGNSKLGGKEYLWHMVNTGYVSVINDVDITFVMARLFRIGLQRQKKDARAIEKLKQLSGSRKVNTQKESKGKCDVYNKVKCTKREGGDDEREIESGDSERGDEDVRDLKETGDELNIDWRDRLWIDDRRWMIRSCNISLWRCVFFQSDSSQSDDYVKTGQDLFGMSIVGSPFISHMKRDYLSAQNVGKPKMVDKKIAYNVALFISSPMISMRESTTQKTLETTINEATDGVESALQ